MSRSLKSEDRLIEYLLGLMPEEEQIELEDVYLHDDVLNEEIQAAERELMDRYLEGSLPRVERERFERFFLCTPARKERLRFARALRAHGASIQSVRGPATIRAAAGSRAFSIAMFRPFATAYGGRALLAVLVIAIGIAAWRAFLFNSPDRQAMTALGNAYGAGRLCESRISGLGYAPMAQARGDGKENAAAVDFRQAELIALKESGDHPGAGSFHTLGRVYLAQQKLSEAVGWLRKAAAAGAGDAAIQSDLGAALLELAGQDTNLETQTREMTESLDSLTRAIELNQSLLEARFNRALWYERWHLPEKAEIEWRDYLGRDAKSRWADEARKRLADLEERKTRTSLGKERDFEDFVAAAPAGDEAAAWRVLSRNRDRIDNKITRRLIDEFLAAGDSPAGAAKLRLVSLAGSLEVERASDRFTADLAGYYLRAGPSQLRLVSRARGSFKSASHLYDISEYERAARAYSQAERVFSQAGDKCEALASRFWVGASYLRAPDCDKALAIFEPLVQLASGNSYRLLLAQSLIALTEIEAIRREFSKSQDSADKSMDLFERIDDVSGLLRGLQAMVLYSQQFGEYYKSIGFAIRALNLASGFSPELREIWPFYHQIASGLNSLGRPAAALEFQQQALRVALESRTPALISISYGLLALIHQNLADYSEAFRNGELALNEAQQIEEEKSRTNLVAGSTLYLAHLYQASGSLDQARLYYDKAIELHRRMDIQTYVVDAHKGRLQTLLGLKDKSAAEEEIGTSIRILERDRPKIREDENRTSYFDLAQSTYDLAIDFAYFQKNDSRQALEIAEASRARSLLDLLLGGKVVAGRNGAELKVDRSTRSLRLNEIQRRLPQNTQVVEYSVLEDKIITWVVSRESVESVYQPIATAELSDRVAQFLNSINQPAPRDHLEASRLGASLYELLIQPVSGFLLPGGTVFIVPDKGLNNLPFGALVDPGSGRYFVEDHLFAVAPSSTIMVSCSERAAEKRAVNSESALTVGNPSFDRRGTTSLPDLPAAAREADTVAQLYRNSVSLTGLQAQGRLVKWLMQNADVIQLAGHYLADPHSPLLSRFPLSGSHSMTAGDSAEDDLTVADVYSLDLRRARLVVLSACGTEIERTYRGEGAVGLARPFLKAGAPLVVASLWPVDSEQTSQLMIDFHRCRKLDGMSTMHALQQAQRDMIANPHAEPGDLRTWAAFAVVGGYAEF